MGAAKVLTQNSEEVISMLKSCLLFQEADPPALAFAAQFVEAVYFRQGEPIILENESNDHVYFVHHGSVEIVNYVSEHKRVQRLVLLKPGSHFAEFSVLTGEARSGSAYAYEDCELLKMDGRSFLKMLKQFPLVSQKLVKLIAELNMRIEGASTFIPFYQANQLNISRDVMNVVPAPMWRKFGVIPLTAKAGVLSVAMKDPNNEPFYQFLKTSFPNLEVSLFLINENEFDGAVDYVNKWLKSAPQTHSKAAVSDLTNLDPKSQLKASRFFSSLPDQVVDQLVPHVKSIEVKAGQIIYQPNNQMDSLSLIVRGQVEILRNIEHSKVLGHVLTLGPGDSLGEVSILTNTKTIHSARATEDCILLTLPRAVMSQLQVTPLFTLPLAKILAKRLQRLGQQAGLRYFTSEEPLDFRHVCNLLPQSVISEQRVIPLKVVDNEVHLGIAHLDSSKVLAAVGRYMMDLRAKLFGITDEQFKAFSLQLKAVREAGFNEDVSHAGSHSTAKNQQVNPVKMLDEILLQAMTNRCSDIHFEPTEEYLSVRYRIDGVLRERGEKIPAALAKEIIGRLKVLSNMDISNQKIPQDGQFKINIEETLVMARASTLPIKYGEKAVLRIIRSKNSVAPLNMLAPDRRVINLLQAVARCRQGLFLVTGPTGSGKTTTLYSMLNAINRIDINVITLEDPVEMEIPGFNQVEIDRKRGLDFGKALRSVLRQDPDVIMVGEIRDEESAKIVFEAAITGHLVLSTLHTSSSLDVAPRLEELGVPSATISAGLLGVLTQRLLRANCKKCLISRPVTDSEKQIFREMLKMENPPEALKFGKGCPACNNSGYHDRIPVFEVWRNTLTMRRALIDNLGMEQLMKIAREDGFETLLEFGLKMVLNGLTTLEEVKRVLSNV